MNDGLLALKRLKGEGRGNGIYDEIDVCQDFDRAEYYLQVIDIIKEKEVVISILIRSSTLDEYNNNPMFVSKQLTQEEYEHLIEVFDND